MRETVREREIARERVRVREREGVQELIRMIDKRCWPPRHPSRLTVVHYIV